MNRCKIVVGRSIAHPCGQRAGADCPQCSRPVCRAHYLADRSLCVECAGVHRPPDADVEVTEEEMFAFDDGDVEAFDANEAGRVPRYDS